MELLIAPSLVFSFSGCFFLQLCKKVLNQRNHLVEWVRRSLLGESLQALGREQRSLSLKECNHVLASADTRACTTCLQEGCLELRKIDVLGVALCYCRAGDDFNCFGDGCKLVGAHLLVFMELVS